MARFMCPSDSMATISSKDSSGYVRWWASATSNRTCCPSPSRSACSLASSTWRSMTDTPSTRAPVARAIRSAGSPVPQPRSSTLAPGPAPSRATTWSVRCSWASVSVLGSSGESHQPRWKFPPPSLSSISEANS